MQDIAREAGVVVQTIYASVGSKQDLLRAINDLVDQEGGVAAIEAEMADAADGAELLRLAVQLTTQINQRCADIIRAVHAGAASEPAMAELLEEGRRRHREGMRGVAMALGEQGLLPAGLPPEEAARALAVLTSNETYFQLADGYGMSFEAAGAWLLSLLESLLLVPTSQEGRNEHH